MNPRLILPSGALVHSPLVVRVAGLPASVLGALRSAESFAEAERLAELDDRLTAEAGELADALYPVIGSPAAVEAKPHLVGLRRALHRRRAPGGGEWNAKIAAVLPVGTAARIDAWVGGMEEYERRRLRLPAALEREAPATLAALRDTAGDPGFRRALSLASPALHEELSKWLADGGRKVRGPSLVRLAKYVTRAAAKTSPFSTFTVSGTALWAVRGPAVRLDDDVPVAGVLELDGLLLRLLYRAVCDDPRLGRSLRVRVNPSATRHRGMIGFLGSRGGEPILSIPATPAVTRCLEILEEDTGLTLSGLRDRLAEGHDDPAAVLRFLEALLAAGLLERPPPVTDHAGDPLGPLSRRLGAGEDTAEEAEKAENAEVAENAENADGEHGGKDGNGGVATIGALVERARVELLRHVPVADVEGHLGRQRALRRAVEDLRARLGLPRGDDRGAFHENAVFTGPAASCSLPRWRAALEDLDTLRHWLAALDPALPLRVALGAFCGERFGPGVRVPFLLFHRAVHDERARRGSRHGRLLGAVFGARPGETVDPHGVPRMRELNHLRRVARQAATTCPIEDGVRSVAPFALTSLAAGWPEWLPTPPSLACYVQVIDGQGPIRLVVNAAHTGCGRGRSRVLHLLRRAGGTAPEDPAWRSDASATPVAELGGTFASSLNRRVPSAPYEIDYPFAASGRPDAERLPLSDLEVVHDARTGMVRLLSRRLGGAVRPLHLGMMADLLLPPAARLLALGFGSSYLLYPGMPLLEEAAEEDRPEDVVPVPRVEVGRVVVRRARWVAPAARVPLRRKGERDADHYLRLVAWVRSHGIPARCFVRAPAAGRDRLGAVLDKSRKPIYMDFANGLLVTAFDRMVRAAGPVVVFEEALPDPEAGGGSVTEFLLEISEREDGHG
ncbi:lantibiotic dehydratase [Streptosporangium sp. NPDC023615]|uniref:lantibiotic dehydratase n=1 Tax=Streptosporangium sp. NPDC023615 TaxID=3154794 RepID=UPI00343BB8A0